ncbi:hypothetical protein CPB83DRAFT_859286 [Crepidotus variabilis]|uniref:Uncharacterized protein n=1 Tax=Crepidotus variabilis TaxID=179855 RepID=A0A9P6EAQ3_9AGAR|nr:hypothetical protein CPB83DRAFT_859286 [Crepidotus variabilis]
MGDGVPGRQLDASGGTYSSAPGLKVLTIHPSTQQPGLDLLPTTTSQSQASRDVPQPFPKYLPSLEYLQLGNTLISFNSHSVHAFSKLHTLFLRFSLNVPTTTDLLTALARMPLLKVFGLRNAVIHQPSNSDVDKTIPFSILDLPNLQSLSLATNAIACTTLLTFLKPTSNRRLHIKALSHHSIPTGEVEDLLTCLRPHAESYFNQSERRIEHVTVSLAEPVWVSVSAKPRDFMFQFFSPIFFLWFAGSMPVDTTVNPFRNCRFDTVKQLSLERRRPVEPYLIGFLAQFVNVEVLNISVRHLANLAKPDEQSILFPRLQTIVLDLHHDPNHCTKHESSRMVPISEWLKSRKRRGQVIKILDLGITPKMSLDARSLEDVEGLIVRWTNIDKTEPSEYICGSGNSELLHFPHLSFESQCSLPEFAAHSPEELRFAYMMFGREMSSADLLKSTTTDSSIRLADELRLLQVS